MADGYYCHNHHIHSVRCLVPPASQQYFFLTAPAPASSHQPANSIFLTPLQHQPLAPAQRTEWFSTRNNPNNSIIFLWISHLFYHITTSGRKYMIRPDIWTWSKVIWPVGTSFSMDRRESLLKTNLGKRLTKKMNACEFLEYLARWRVFSVGSLNMSRKMTWCLAQDACSLCIKILSCF